MAPRRALHALATIAVAFLAAACSPHLAGTNDAAIEYRVGSDARTGTPMDPAAAASLVKGRLNAAQLLADVDVTPSGAVRVVVDGEAAQAVDGLLAWRGGVDAYVVADGAPWSADAKLDADHVAFVERVAGNAVGRLVVHAPAALRIGAGAAPFTSIRAAMRGRALALGVPDGATQPLSSAVARLAATRVAFVRDHVLLATLPAGDVARNPIVLSFGDDIAAYTRAYHARLLIESPYLPALERTLLAPLAPRWGLAAACALLPLVISLAWLSFVRRFDRARPEPRWLVLATFALGALAVALAGLAEYALTSATPWLDPVIATLGGQVMALPFAVVVSTIVVGVSEEGAKLLAVRVLAYRRREFDEPVDGIVYACAAALGFAAAENVKYFAFGRMSGSVIAIRSFLTVPAHMFFAAIWGHALGRTLVSRRARVLPAFALAALAHGLFDATLSIGGVQIVATVLVCGLAVAFVSLLRRSLAHGAVVREPDAAGGPDDQARASGLPREAWRVGSPSAFFGYAVAMVVCAFGMTVLGTAYEVLHHRVGALFVGIASVVLGLFGAAAYGVSETVPLDAVVDEHGLTFSGATTRWSDVRSAAVLRHGRRAFLVLETTTGAARVGPTSDDQAAKILAAVRRTWQAGG